jgi:LmbE family N-acetylglucosaminyl deacetylase
VDAQALWGHLDPAVLAKILVVSPHFDDAALGVAHLLVTYPGSTVVTVLGGRPPAYPDEVTEWDRLGGFVTGDDVVAVRQAEDKIALACLDAISVWLDFPDHQYLAPEARPRPAAVAPELRRTIDEVAPSAVFLPMGLANPDHLLAHDAGLLVRADLIEAGQPMSWFCYEDAGYKHLPGMLAWRVAKLWRAGVWPTPAIVPVRPDMARKAAAIRLYKTQVPPLERDHLLSERLEANVPEQYWRLEPPPADWDVVAWLEQLDSN